VDRLYKLAFLILVYLFLDNLIYPCCRNHSLADGARNRKPLNVHISFIKSVLLSGL